MFVFLLLLLLFLFIHLLFFLLQLGTGMDHKSTWYCNAPNKVKIILIIVVRRRNDTNRRG